MIYLGQLGTDTNTVRCDRRLCRQPAIDLVVHDGGVWRVCDRHTPRRFHRPRAAYAVVLGAFAVVCAVAALTAALWVGSPAAYIATGAGIIAAVTGAWLLFTEDPF